MPYRPKSGLQEMEPPSGRTDVPGSMQSNDHRSDLNPGTVGSAHRVQCPPLSQVLSELASLPPASTLAATEPLPSEEQKKLFESLQKCLKAAENADISDALKETPDILQKLWKCRSPYLVPAAEAMANGSRARKSSTTSVVSSSPSTKHFLSCHLANMFDSLMADILWQDWGFRLLPSAYSVEGDH